jgi:folate-binding protein YgfZ
MNFMAEPIAPWLEFLSTQAVNLESADMHGGMVAALTHLGVLAVSGADAETFLHSQLTNDAQNLSLGAMHLGGYCSPKGRLLTTLLIWKSNEGVMLVMPRELLPGIQRRLQMFVLRSKVTIADVSEQIVLIGAAAPDTQEIGFSDAAGLNAVWPSAAGLQRALWMGPVESAMRLWETLSTKLSPMNASHWRWLDIRAGLPMVVEATREQFVPQMVNFDLIGGVNFRKGCYPGQEIVARSQYLGKLKRRMLLASTQAELVSAGMEIFSEADPGQPCGLVVNAEKNPAGLWDLLVEIKLDAAQTPVHLVAANGDRLQFLEMPYVIRDPE